MESTRPNARTVEGFLRPVGDPPPGIPVTLHFAQGRLAISGEDIGRLGEWDVADLDASRTEEGAVMLVEGEALLATFDDEDLERALVETLIKRPLWVRALPILGGLVLALTIWALAV